MDGNLKSLEAQRPGLVHSAICEAVRHNPDRKMLWAADHGQVDESNPLHQAEEAAVLAIQRFMARLGVGSIRQPAPVSTQEPELA